MIIRNLIYILQGENYYFGRFLRFAYSHPKWWSLENRGKISWTKKSVAICIVSILIIISVCLGAFLGFGLASLFIFVLVSIICLPFIIGLSLLFVSPLDSFLKNGTMKEAGHILEANRNIVIGITGSYGKTSMKEILSAIISKKYDVINTPENVNTDIGIAEFIVKNRSRFSESKVFIVEMGAYRRGEIGDICRMVKPDYSILTGINESHLERFGNIGNTIAAKFELPENTAKMSVLNFDDENIRNSADRFRIKHPEKVSAAEAADIIVKDNFGGLEFSYDGMRFETKLLAKHNIALILLGIRIAKELGLSNDEIRSGISSIGYIPHRLEPIFNTATGVIVIDDSYNGNMNGIKSGLEVLGRASGRKVVLTPGLVELGEKSQEIHEKIGESYARSADLVLLIKSPASGYIIDGLKLGGFSEFKLYATTQEAHADLANILRKGDTIIFQNDLTDNYF
ncbi:MAG: UDP-N-acetylmuramoyl-tripeptide--D-alanyl-D-alanine ligase [Candidatus Moranbacteria bacterium]|nr:UDP-N-acetylmuramoyl-tripeptide--D-alanyl-D-alanine ligase [Candidatus Moranbacteria bacterium]